MKYIDEYRNFDAVKALSKKIHDISKKDISIMEICGGQTHTILKYNIEQFLPENITLIHGPGCPVCVTSVSLIDKAISLASRDGVILVSFGDMLRVPGSEQDLLSVKANGGDVRMVYSPLDAVKIAKDNPDKKVVFFAVGFETTAPSNARSVLEAKKLNLKNYFLLCANMLVPPAIEALMNNKNVKIQGLLAAGHVCTVMGLKEYEIIAEKYHIPIVATGFEPLDIITGIYEAVRQIEEEQHEVVNRYSRAVTREGNIHAQKLIEQVFDTVDKEWRGIGTIPQSGLSLKDEFSEFDADKNFKFNCIKLKENTNCIAGEILQGIRKPVDCISFGKECNPEHPLGAPMVSSEGACAAYFRYRKEKTKDIFISV
jgi:hydrogenase expression/formation protein HypD